MDRFVDFVVRAIYADAACDPTQAQPTPALAKILCGPDSIHRASSNERFPSCTSDTGDGRLTIHVPASACQPKDLTGAGDMLAGAFLYGLTRGVSAAVALRAANFLAAKVICQVGARLHHGTRQFWDDAVAGA